MPERRILDTETDPEPESMITGTAQIKDEGIGVNDETYLLWQSLSGHQLEHNITLADWQSHLTPELEICVCTLIDKLSTTLTTDTLHLSICWTDNLHIKALNAEFRSQDKPTNILSFPSDEDEHIGDLVLGYEVILDEAEKLKIPMQNHLAHLLLHGILHLLGYDHIEEDEADIMEGLEAKLLADVNIENPYSNSEQGDVIS